jgi:universal stress protein E
MRYAKQETSPMSNQTGGTLLIVGLSDGLESDLIGRALQVAEALALDVEIYHPLTLKPVPAALPGIPGALTGTANLVQAEETRELRLGRCEEALRAALESLRVRGIVARGRVEWKVARVAAVLERIGECSPRLVMTAAHAHGRLADLFGSDDDLELVRCCPKPLWLVRNAPRTANVVLAAVDPMHENDRACAVDHAVLDEAMALAHALEKRPHALHTFCLPTRLPGVLEATAPDIAHERYQQADDRHTRRMHELARAHGLSAEHTQVVQGDLIETLQGLIGSLGVDVVVTGALSRSRLKRMLIGSTAERLLRAIDTDIVVVKNGYHPTLMENPNTESSLGR